MKAYIPWLIAMMMCLLISSAAAQEGATRTVSIAIFEERVRSFAPGIDAIMTLTAEQEQQLAAAYRGVFNTTGVRLANMVLRDSDAPIAQRQMAEATLRQAEADFQARSRTIFTGEQRQLIDRVYQAFTRVYEAAEQAMVQQVTRGLASELDQILAPEQKAAMAARRAEMEKAQAGGGETGTGGSAAP